MISFGAVEPDFATPEHVVAAAARACYDPENHKVHGFCGSAATARAIAEDVGRYSGVEVDWSEVMVTNGAKQAVFQAFAALLDPGDEVLLPSPHWVTYPAGIDLAGGITVSVPTRIEDEFKVDVESLERARTDRTAAARVRLSPPTRPGLCTHEDEARAIGEWAKANDIWVMADEIYSASPTSPTWLRRYSRRDPSVRQLVLINGVAKSYSMTGWRVGWMVGPSDIIDAANSHQSHATATSTTSPNMPPWPLRGPQDTWSRDAPGVRQPAQAHVLSGQ